MHTFLLKEKYTPTRALDHIIIIFFANISPCIVRNNNIYFPIFNDKNTDGFSDIFSYKTFFTIFSVVTCSSQKLRVYVLMGFMMYVDRMLYNKNATVGSAKYVFIPMHPFGSSWSV